MGIEQHVTQEDFQKLTQQCATQAVEIQAMKQIVDAKTSEAKAHTDTALNSVLAAEKAMERSVGWTRWTLGPFMALIVGLMIFLTQRISSLAEKVERNDAAVSQQLMSLQRDVGGMQQDFSGLQRNFASLQRSIENLDAKVEFRQDKKPATR